MFHSKENFWASRREEDHWRYHFEVMELDVDLHYLLYTGHQTRLINICPRSIYVIYSLRKISAHWALQRNKLVHMICFINLFIAIIKQFLSRKATQENGKIQYCAYLFYQLQCQSLLPTSFVDQSYRSAALISGRVFYCARVFRCRESP